MRRISFAITCLGLLVSTSVFAETTTINLTRLESLYAQLLKAPDNTYLQTLIAGERANIRKQIEEELKNLVATDDSETVESVEELTKAVDKQRTVVAALEQTVDERKADLDLLAAEEEHFYPRNGTPVSDDDTFRLTKSHGELLALRALHEERVAALESLIDLQEQRLRQLTNQQRLEQFGLLINIAKYVLIVLLVLWFEQTIRSKFIAKIRDHDKRYKVVKLFTATVYALLILWLMGVVYDKHPEILASVAIIGAGLAIALQDIVKDMVGWFSILQNRLFVRGQRITVGDITGEVIDYGLLRTNLLEVGMPKVGDPYGVFERTGKLLSLPNATFLTQPITNHTTTSGFVRAEMRFTITYESNWRKAKDIAQRVIDEKTKEFVEEDERQFISRTHMFFMPRQTSGNHVFYDIASDGVELTLRFTVPIGERRPIVSEMADMILELFNKEPDIELAYATRRIVN